MRLIDADALKEKAIKVSTVKRKHIYLKAVGTREIARAPTIDAEPVVRCKDCKHRGTDDCPMHYKGVPADEDFLKKVDNDFCSYGERRSNNK